MPNRSAPASHWCLLAELLKASEAQSSSKGRRLQWKELGLESGRSWFQTLISCIIAEGS